MKNYDVPALIATKTGVPRSSSAVRYAPWRPRRYHVPWHHAVHGRPVRIASESTQDSTPARLRRAWATQQLQRILEVAVLDGRERQSIFEAFLDAVAAQGRRSHIIEDVKEQPKSYHDLLKGSLAIGRWARRRTRAGENVGVLLPNVIPTVCTVLGLIAFGRVPAMLNYTRRPDRQHAARVAAARVRTVITSRAFVEQARSVDADRRIRRSAAGVPGGHSRASSRWRDKLWLMAFRAVVAAPRDLAGRSNGRRWWSSRPARRRSPKAWS